MTRLHTIKHNLAASAPPASTDDESQGYATGSLWLDRAHGSLFACFDAAGGAAVWQVLTEDADTRSELATLKARVTKLTARVRELEAAAPTTED